MKTYTKDYLLYSSRDFRVRLRNGWVFDIGEKVTSMSGEPFYLKSTGYSIWGSPVSEDLSWNYFDYNDDLTHRTFDHLDVIEIQFNDKFGECKWEKVRPVQSLTKEEKDFLSIFELSHQNFYITRHNNGSLWVNLRKPRRKTLPSPCDNSLTVKSWVGGKNFLRIDNNLFKFIKADDDEVYSIKDLLELMGEQ